MSTASRPESFVPTEEQRRVLDSQKRIRVCYGSPGTGKTSVGLSACIREIETGGRPLVLTFSRGAAFHLLGKIRKSPLSIQIQTYHAFARHMVRSWSRYYGYPPRCTILHDRQQKRLRDAGVDLAKHAQSTGEMTFQTMLELALLILRGWPELRNLYSARHSLIVLDEFQDTSDEQWELVKLLFGDHRLLILGDPDQSIYGWAGARPQRLVELIENPSNEMEVVRLTRPQRCDEGIALCCEALLTGNLPPEDSFRQALIVRDFAYWNGDGSPALRNLVVELQKRGAKSIAICGRRREDVDQISHHLSNPTRAAPFAIPHLLLDEERPERIDRIVDLLVAEADAEVLGVENVLARKWGDALSSLGHTKEGALLVDLGTSLNTDRFRAVLGNDEKRFLSLWEDRWKESPFEIDSGGERLLDAIRRLGLNLESIEDLEEAQSQVRTVIRAAKQGRADDHLQLVRARRAEQEVGASAPGVYVMTMHRGKGKEFDATLMVVTGNEFMFNQSKHWNGERLVLYVTASRARHFLGLLIPKKGASQLFSPLLK